LDWRFCFDLPSVLQPLFTSLTKDLAANPALAIGDFADGAGGVFDGVGDRT